MANYIIKAPQVPYPHLYEESTAPETSTWGLSQPDVLLQTAIQAGLAELRKYPDLLNYAFAWLAKDPITQKKYGIKALEKAKAWFINTNINVSLNVHPVDPNEMPIVSIGIESSEEVYNTLGDVNATTSELVQASDVISYFSSTINTYDTTTGIMTVTNPRNVEIVDGLLVLDLDTKQTFPITEVDSNTQFYIDTGVTSPLRNVAIVPANQYYVAELESARFKESYSITCVTNTTHEDAMYLYSVVLFALLRHRESYLEARNFEQVRYTVGGLSREQWADKEVVFGRTIMATGMIQQYWPKSILPSIQGVLVTDLQIASNRNGPVVTEDIHKEPWTTIREPELDVDDIPDPFD